MLKGISIIEDRILEDFARYQCAATNSVSILKFVGRLPNLHELPWLLGAVSPEVALLEIAEQSLPLVAGIRSQSPHTVIVGLTRADTQAGPAPVSLAGTIPIITPRATCEEFEVLLRGEARKIFGTRRSNVFVFLPGKAGNGSSTVAFNVATLIAKSLGRKSLLIEADLHSGVLSTLLNVNPKNHMRAVLTSMDTIDRHAWQRAVISVQGLHLLLADKSKKEPIPSWADYLQLLNFASPQYDSLVFDLPEVVNDATREVVLCAERTFVVCTPELPSLALAKQRVLELHQHGVAEDRISLVLNRWHSSDISVADVEKLVGYPVDTVIPNDYKRVNDIVAEGASLDVNSNLGRPLLALARKVSGEVVPAAAPKGSVFTKLRRHLSGSPTGS